MLQDLAALAPSLIVAVAFLWGVWALVRRELAPKKRRAAGRSAASAAAGNAQMASRVPGDGKPAAGAETIPMRGEANQP